eukprot:TRINITY_DN81420_c0_g1_i1.p1 TRINITY_DN81420_c0_g1~~TRINITY_DN81420_c0_g1_i1.p1  ORF type:complete len:262 (-),score=53.49 TRINITY_DN81420_c0_g1_i1:40-798(-)
MDDTPVVKSSSKSFFRLAGTSKQAGKRDAVKNCPQYLLELLRQAEDSLDDIDIYFLNGDCVTLQGLLPNSRVADIMQGVQNQVSIPPGSSLQLMSGQHLLDPAELVSTIEFSHLTAAIVPETLSTEALKQLVKLKHRCDGLHSWNVQFLEIQGSFNAALVAEILSKTRLQRLIFDTKKGEAARLAKALQSCGELRCLETLEVGSTSLIDLAAIGSILRRCPKLQSCNLEGDSLTCEDVSELRSEFSAVNITI